MGLRKVRIGERVRVKVGTLAGQEGLAVDVGNTYVMIELDGTATVTMKLDDVVRLVDSATDAADLELARSEFAKIDLLLEQINDKIVVFEQKVVAEAAREAGLPEALLVALGLLPEIRKLPVSGEVQAVLTKIAEGLTAAAALVGIGKPVLGKLLGRD